jgi:hypothetical protein
VDVDPVPLPEYVSNGIRPLKVGYYWEYKTYIARPDSTLGAQIGHAKYKVARMSVGTAAARSDTLFHVVWVNPSTNQQDTYEWFFRNYPDGLYIMGGRMPTDSVYTALHYLRYPVTAGETWMCPHLVYEPNESKYMIADTSTFRCVDTNARFETPVGTFFCVVYNHLQKSDPDVGADEDIYEYYSKNVGKVGSVTYNYFESLGERHIQSKTILVGTNVMAR